ncbi:hypothetical protein [Lysinibacillus xylanilyticus]|uniref:Uncharacterized protein n=1 Tax=Lysinibacillus xylanilyticus TaxID=582475 RepID=A0ABT4EL08_9BACI|nr:hypothetical protein [Lysinibacillus xylanilyticus]MCY9546370.1 hypothetical protein [Lysinibacillus xylanilyticus]
MAFQWKLGAFFSMPLLMVFSIQVMMRDDFDVDAFYQQFEKILETLHRLGK